MNSETHQQSTVLLPQAAGADVSPKTEITNINIDRSGNTGQRAQLDALGPMVVNSDGTLSRIANWTQMTDAEQQRTLRVLSARNKLRLANEEKKQQEVADARGPAAGSGLGQERLSILDGNSYPA